MHPLDDAARRRALTWSALLCAIPLCLAPLAGRSSLEVASERATFDARFNAPTLAATWNDRPVNVARDPFIPETRPTDVPSPPPDIVGMHVTAGQPIGYVASTPLSRSSVTAIVSGPSPRALVDDGVHVRVVGIGDILAGSRIVSIDGMGVRLQNGTLLGLAEDGP